MKKLGWFLLVLILLSAVAYGFGGPSPRKEEGGTPAVSVGEKYVIGDFESGSLRAPKEWWTFDIQTADVVSNLALTSGDGKIAAEVGKYSMQLKGTASNWYAGGCGTYFAKENQNLAKYNYLQLDMFGNGPGSGTLKIELYDDDNHNWQVEQDPAKGYAPIYDDKFVYDINVDWVGWKRISIPPADFVDDNPGVGDDVWNPEQAGGSGGLLQMQFICIAAKSEGSVNYNIDNVYLTVSE